MNKKLIIIPITILTVITITLTIIIFTISKNTNKYKIELNDLKNNNSNYDEIIKTLNTTIEKKNMK